MTDLIHNILFNVDKMEFFKSNLLMYHSISMEDYSISMENSQYLLL